MASVTPVLPISTMGWHFWVRTEAEEPPGWKSLHFPEGSNRRGKTQPISAANSSLPWTRTHCSGSDPGNGTFPQLLHFPPKVNFSQCLLQSQASAWHNLTAYWAVAQEGTERHTSVVLHHQSQRWGKESNTIHPKEANGGDVLYLIQDIPGFPCPMKT